MHTSFSVFLLRISMMFLQAVLETVAKITHDKVKRNDTRETKYVKVFEISCKVNLQAD